MKRGDLVTVALQGNYGKPRPALVIQADVFSEHPSITILPITSDCRTGLLFRVNVSPTESTGLDKPSQIMVDKPQTVAREKIGAAFGRLDEAGLLAVNRALAVFLGLG